MPSSVVLSDNIRTLCSRLTLGLAYRGYVPSTRAYFHGLKIVPLGLTKLHLPVDQGKFIQEVHLTPGSVHDLASLLLLPLDLPEGGELYLDRGYESHLCKDLPRPRASGSCLLAR